MRRFIAALTVTALLLTACGEDLKPPAAQQPDSWVYVPEFFSLEGEYIDYSGMKLSGDCLYYLSMEYDDEIQHYTQNMGSYSLKERTSTVSSLSWPEEPYSMNIRQYTFGTDGCMYAIAMAYPTDSQPRTYLCKFDTEGKCLFSQDITDHLQDASGSQSYISSLEADSSGRLYMAGSQTVWLYDEEGNLKGQVSPDSSADIWISSLLQAGNGKVYISCQTPGSGSGGYTLAEIDFENKSLTSCCTDFPGRNAFAPGLQEDLLMQDRTYLYTYDPEEQNAQMLFGWLDCDINGNSVLSFGESDDGSIVVVMEDSEKGGEIALLKKTEAGQAAQKENITLAVWSDGYNYQPAAVKFNRDQNRYHITIQEYMDYSDNSPTARSDALTRLYADITSDNCPDIVELTGLDVELLAAKGVFTDLNTYLESSSFLGSHDFLEEILDAYTFDGVLISIPSLFFLETVMGSSAQLGTEPGWTLEEMVALADANPGAELFDGADKKDILSHVLLYNQDAFIDWSTGTCSFDSRQFQDLLQFAGRFPEEISYDPDRPSTPVRIQNGEVLLKDTFLYDFDSIQMDMAMFSKEAVCIGYPSPDGSPRHGLTTAYAYAITSKSDKKEGAWLFIENVLKEEENSRNQMGFPTLKRRLDAMIEDAMKVEYILDEQGNPYLDEDGNPIISGTHTTGLNGWSYTYHTATQEEVDMVLSLLDGAALAPGGSRNQIMGIISEEAEAFYQGRKTVSEAAEIIQNRINVYVNEHR